MTMLRLRPQQVLALLVLPLLLLPLRSVASPAEPRPEQPSTIALPPGFAPEDMARGRGSSFYVASLAGEAGVYAGDLRTGRGHVVVPGEKGRTDVGVFVDKLDRLWGTGGSAGDVRVYDAATGEPLASYQLNSGGGFISDIFVTDGMAYLTDSFEPRLYAIALGRGPELPGPRAVRTVPLSGDIEYTEQPFAFNANGIAEHGGQLILGQTNTGKLFTADPETGLTREIDLGGSDVFGADGIVMKGRTLYISENFPQSLSVVNLDGRLTSGRVTERITDDRFDIPTSVVVFGGGLYALNARLTTAVTPHTPYTIVRVDRP